MLTKDELQVGYEKLLGDEAAEEVDKIFQKVDIDESGKIEYSEWIVATIDLKKLLTPEKLHDAFNLFDKDNSGSISAQEVKDVLCSGQEVDDDVWDKIIAQNDTDGDHEISLEEFCSMMQKMLNYEDEDSDDEPYSMRPVRSGNPQSNITNSRASAM